MDSLVPNGRKIVNNKQLDSNLFKYFRIKKTTSHKPLFKNPMGGFFFWSYERMDSLGPVIYLIYIPEPCVVF